MNQKGQGIVEYALIGILALVVIIVVANLLGPSLKNIFGSSKIPKTQHVVWVVLDPPTLGYDVCKEYYHVDAEGNEVDGPFGPVCK